MFSFTRRSTDYFTWLIYSQFFSNGKCTPLQWLKWSCEAGGGLTWRSQVGANPIRIPHPTDFGVI